MRLTVVLDGDDFEVSTSTEDAFVVRLDIASGFSRDTIAYALTMLAKSVVDEKAVPHWPQ
jgi:hypothetical protein